MKAAKLHKDAAKVISFLRPLMEAAESIEAIATRSDWLEDIEAQIAKRTVERDAIKDEIAKLQEQLLAITAEADKQAKEAGKQAKEILSAAKVKKAEADDLFEKAEKAVKEAEEKAADIKVAAEKIVKSIERDRQAEEAKLADAREKIKKLLGE